MSGHDSSQAPFVLPLPRSLQLLGTAKGGGVVRERVREGAPFPGVFDEMTVVRCIGAAAKAIGNSGVGGGWMNGRRWPGRARRVALNHRSDRARRRRRHYVLFGT